MTARQRLAQLRWNWEHSLAAYEDEAEDFRRHTGMMAPGKSSPEGDYRDDDRRNKWDARMKERREEVHAAIREVLDGDVIDHCEFGHCGCCPKCEEKHS